ncbi:MAG: WG repeat-containing protein [Bacillota bacterium]|nr:WG repeat-containing protein [Bacillota bacterium]
MSIVIKDVDIKNLTEIEKVHHVCNEEGYEYVGIYDEAQNGAQARIHLVRKDGTEYILKYFSNIKVGGYGGGYINGDTFIYKDYLEKVEEINKSFRIERALASDEQLRSHPNIARTLVADDITFTDGKVRLTEWFIIMKKYQPLSLDVGSSPNIREEKEALRLGVQICDALIILHERKDLFMEESKAGGYKGILHGDIKPENILVEETEKGIYNYVLADFGMSKLKGSISTVSNVRGGTLYAMSPEYAKGNYSTKADLYALCATLYMLLNKGTALSAQPQPRVVREYNGNINIGFKGQMPEPTNASSEMKELLVNSLEYESEDRKCKSARVLKGELQRIQFKHAQEAYKSNNIKEYEAYMKDLKEDKIEYNSVKNAIRELNIKVSLSGLHIDDDKDKHNGLKGQIVKEYDEVRNYCENLAAVKKNNKWGYIDRKGNVVIPIIFDAAMDFSEGRTFVRKGPYLDNTIFGEWWMLDESGNKIYAFRESFPIRKFNNGRACIAKKNRIKKEARFVLVDKNGWVVSRKYESIIEFEEGYAKVNKGGKCGYIDRMGHETIPIIYDDGNYFHEGRAAVKKDGKWGFINKKGKMVGGFLFESVHDFSEGLAAVKKDNRWGYIDKEYKEIVPIIYEDVSDFKDGRAVVKENGLKFFINKKGNIVVPFTSDSVHNLELGHNVKKNDEKNNIVKGYGFIIVMNEFENEVIGMIYNSITIKKEKGQSIEQMYWCLKKRVQTYYNLDLDEVNSAIIVTTGEVGFGDYYHKQYWNALNVVKDGEVQERRRRVLSNIVCN